MWTTFIVFIEFVTIVFPFHVLVFGRQACGFLVPRPGIEPAPPALGSKGPPGMSRLHLFFKKYLLIYLAVPSLSSIQTLSYSM